MAKLIVMKLSAPNPDPLMVMDLPTFPWVALSVIEAVPVGAFVSVLVVVPVFVPVVGLVPVFEVGEPFAVTVNVAVAMLPEDVVAVTV